MTLTAEQQWRIYSPIVVLGILILSALFRWNNINWDEGTHLHPDERFLTMIGSAIETPDNLLGYFNTSESLLNPHNHYRGDGSQEFPDYVYGNVPMTSTRILAERVADYCSGVSSSGENSGSIRDSLCKTDEGRLINYTGYDGVHLVGRFLSGFLDIVAVFFVYKIGKNLNGLCNLIDPAISLFHGRSLGLLVSRHYPLCRSQS